jgi:peptidoglycan/LPS O-acetylase OafA/YrhL
LSVPTPAFSGITDSLHRQADSAHVYRADIDGLRAIAVLSVTFQHYRVPGFGGGFAGVDVFFVISGFLIAARIASDLAAGRFSLLAFYERRIRRIVPALFVMCGLTLLASAVILFPPALYPQSRMAALVIPFLANYAFYEQAGAYGGEFASRIALLHTWSLAVEEQFYLFFPLSMLVIERFWGRRYLAVLGLLASVSLVSCVLAVRVAPLATFYLPQFRAWELLAGALLALGKFIPPRAPRVRGSIALSGLLLIVATNLLISFDTPYPSEFTLLPCVGAIAILYAACNENEPMGRVLANPVMRRVGWWSYSIYLYHWPLLVLAQYYAFDPLSPATRCLLLAATFVLAALSWRYVEQPFRGPNALLQRPAVYGVAALSGVALMFAAVSLHHFSDSRRYSPRERALFAPDSAVQQQCRNTSPELTKRPPCKLGAAAAPVRAVLWGDSHALAFLPAVDAAYAEHHEAVMFAQQGGCPALPGVLIRDSKPAQSNLLHSWLEAAGYGRSEHCKRHTDAVLDWILQHHIRTVILAGHWIAYTEAADRQWLTDSQSPDNVSLRNNAAIFSRGLGRLLGALQRAQVQVFILDDAPQNTVDVPYALASARRSDRGRDFRISRAQYDAQQHSATEVFTRLQKQYAFEILEPQNCLCAGGKCAIARGDVSLYADEEHLSAAGAMVAEPALEAIWAAQQRH